MPEFKQYLGDGVYADFDGYHIILTAENGIEATDKIALEPDVFQSLLDYRERLIGKLQEQKT